MKLTLLSLLKFNFMMLIVLAACILVLANDGFQRLQPLMAIPVIFAVYKNVQIIWKGRYRIIATVENAALDATASAIEFRQKAEARVKDRAKNRNL
jgi:uncharacterized membrane protein YqjE